MQVFDGHGGPEAATYIRKNAIRLFFEDVNFPQTYEDDNIFLKEVENSLRKAFLLADLALADDHSVSSSSGTTALTAFIFGRYAVPTSTIFNIIKTLFFLLFMVMMFNNGTNDAVFVVLGPRFLLSICTHAGVLCFFIELLHY